MKKYFITAVAALTFGGLMTSCTHDVDGSGSSGDVATNAQESYEKAFLNTFGRPVDGFDWGFGSGNNSTAASTRAMTRAIATIPNKPTFRDGVKNGDNVILPITKPDVPTFDVSTFEDKTGQTFNVSTRGKYKVNSESVIGEMNNNGCDLYVISDMILTTFSAHGTNIIVAAGKKLTLEGINQNVNFYLEEGAELIAKYTYEDDRSAGIWPAPRVLSGDSYTFDNNNTAGNTANLYLSRNSKVKGINITFKNGYKVLNEGGSIESTNLTLYDSNQYPSTLWNEGSVTVTNLSCENEKAYLYNAPNKTVTVTGNLNLINNYDLVYNDGTLNVSGNIHMENTTAEIVNNGSLTCEGNFDMEAGGAFHNVGNAEITGSTLIYNTNSRWMNDGHYTTGTFKDYNCEQVYNNCYMTVEGNFSLGIDDISDSNTGQGGHAYFVMEGGEGENVSGAYVRCDSFSFADCADLFLGNKAFIEVNNSFEATNRNSDYGTHGPASGSYAVIKAASFTKVGNPYISMTYYGKLFIDTPIHYPKGTTQAEPYYVVYDESVQFSFEVQEKPVSIPKTGCSPGYNSNVTPPTPPVTPVTDKVRVIAEDLSTLDGKADFDFNDIVFDVELLSSGMVKITLQAAGGTLPLTVGDPTTELQSPTMEMQKDSQGNDMEEVMKYEVHRLFKVATTTMVNTNAAGGANRDAVSFEIANPSSSNDVKEIANVIPIRVYKGGQWIELAKAVPVTGNATITASKLAVDGTFGWCAERQPLENDSRYQYTDNAGNNLGSRFRMYLQGELEGKWWLSTTEAIR